jgi:hypothetical protein
MSRLPRWMADATRPTAAEVDALLPPPDPRLDAVRRVTAPRAGEVERLLARRVAPVPTRSPSRLWLGAPVLAALAVLFVRQTWPGDQREHGGGAGELHALMVGSPEELVPGVFVDGRGTARAVGPAIELDGVYRVVATVEVELRIRGASVVVEPGEVHVAGDALAVVRGTVRAPDGRFLVSGDRLTLGGRVASRVPEVAPPLPSPPLPPMVEVRKPTAPAVQKVPAAPIPVAPVAPPVEEAPVRPDAVLAWREVLDARDAGLAPRALADRLDAHVRDWPDSPFAGEARALSALALAGVEAPSAGLARLEARIAADPNGPRVGELHAAAALVAREGLKDCERALPHDLWLGNLGPRAGRPTAQALAGLCELHLGRTADGARRLGRLDLAPLAPELADAVTNALETP